MTCIYLDSANQDDVRTAKEAGLIRGVTTNPALMRKFTDDPLRHCSDLLAKIDQLEFYYQPSGSTTNRQGRTAIPRPRRGPPGDSTPTGSR